jgi:hypothetical protein
MKRRDVDLIISPVVDTTNVNSRVFGVFLAGVTEERYELTSDCSVTMQFYSHSTLESRSTNAFDPDDILCYPPQFFEVRKKTWTGMEKWSKVSISDID